MAAKSIERFFSGAVVAATIFYLKQFELVPDWQLFRSYLIYGGNKSILIGILLGIAAGWMLNDICNSRDQRLKRTIVFLYMVVALMFYAQTRTGQLIFVLMCGLVLLRYVSFTWRGMLMIAGATLVLGFALQNATGARERIMGTVHDVKTFTQGGEVSGQGIRLEIYRVTTDIIQEQPIFGHGIGTWLNNYQEQAAGLRSEGMTTPHNDYLLYAAEIGVVGLSVLLWIWIAQLLIAVNIGGVMGQRLFSLGVAVILAGMFNAVLRDTVFGVAFMLLLAIPLAGVRRTRRRLMQA